MTKIHIHSQIFIEGKCELSYISIVSCIIYQIKLSKTQHTNIVKDNKIVYFTTPDWRNSCRQQNTILSHHHYNKFNKIHHIPINQLSVTNKTLPELNYSPINPAFNALLSKVGSKVYSAIASLFSLLGPSNKKHKSVEQEVKKKVVETQKHNENSINNPITSTESQPFTSLITKVTEHSTSALSVLGHTAISTASTVIKSCQEGSKYNLCAGKTSNIISLLLQIPCTIFLGSCIQNNYYLATQILLLLGTDPNSTLSTFTPLEYAILFNRDKIAKLLIENGANIESRDSEGNTPLLIAINQGPTDIAQLLIEKGANIYAQNKSHKNALHFAVHDRGYGYPNLLIPHNKISIVQSILLKPYRPDINAKDIQGYPAIYYAVISRFNSDQSVQLLLDKSASFYYKDKNGDNLILLAAQCHNWKALQLLINFRNREILSQIGGIDTKDSQGRTALHYAASQSNRDVIKFLIKNGASIELHDANHDTPILLAAAHTNWQAVQLLAQYHANVNAQDYKGNTALHYVVSYGREGDPHKNNAIECLIKNGANLSLKNRQGLTPIQIAINNKQHDIAFCILDCYQKFPQNMNIDEAYSILQTAKEQLINQLEENNIVKIYLTMTSWHCLNTKSARSDIHNHSDHPQQVVNESEEYKEESEEEEGYKVAQEVVEVPVLGNSSTDA